MEIVEQGIWSAKWKVRLFVQICKCRRDSNRYTTICVDLRWQFGREIGGVVPSGSSKNNCAENFLSSIHEIIAFVMRIEKQHVAIWTADGTGHAILLARKAIWMPPKKTMDAISKSGWIERRDAGRDRLSGT